MIDKIRELFIVYLYFTNIVPKSLFNTSIHDALFVAGQAGQALGELCDLFLHPQFVFI